MNKVLEQITRVIHWSMALLIIALLVVGFYMTSYENYGYYPLHKSLGVVAGAAILVRLYFRIKYPWRSTIKGSRVGKVAHLAHTGLIVLLILMPLTGVLLSGLGGFGVALFGLELIPANYDESGKAIPINASLSSFGYAAHPIIGYVLTALVATHVLAALKHHLVDKDDTLKRMLGRA